MPTGIAHDIPVCEALCKVLTSSLSRRLLRAFLVQAVLRHRLGHLCWACCASASGRSCLPTRFSFVPLLTGLYSHWMHPSIIRVLPSRHDHIKQLRRQHVCQVCFITASSVIPTCRTDLLLRVSGSPSYLWGSSCFSVSPDAHHCTCASLTVSTPCCTHLMHVLARVHRSPHQRFANDTIRRGP